MDKTGSHYNKRNKSDRGRSKVYGIIYMWDLKKRERCQNHRNRELEGLFPAAEERVTWGHVAPMIQSFGCKINIFSGYHVQHSDWN